MPELPPEVEAQLSQLTEQEWSTLTAKLRAPDAEEQFRTIASQSMSPELVDAWAGILDFSKLTGEDGQIDRAAVEQHIARFHGGQGTPQPQDHQWGSEGDGGAGRLEAERRTHAHLARGSYWDGEARSITPTLGDIFYGGGQ